MKDCHSVHGTGCRSEKSLTATGPTDTIRLAEFRELTDGLRRRGYRCIGPVLRDGAVIYDDIRPGDLLPLGLVDRQSPGLYRLEFAPTPAVFGVHLSHVTWKRFLLPDDVPIVTAVRREDGFDIRPAAAAFERLAFIGIRPCDLQAIETVDLVYQKNPGSAPDYTDRRKHLFVVAVNCTCAADTCFCAAMGTGPEARSGFDICLTEIPDPADHRFLVTTGSAEGRALVGNLKTVSAMPWDLQKVRDLLSGTAKTTAGKLSTVDLKDLLYTHLDHAHWGESASHCLACGNCTMVCPTCFCTTLVDTTDLEGRQAERHRRRDSCFDLSFSYLHGGYVRSSIKARYRHFVIHKLATWVEQFGRFGCVGCGRCITWCPSGIDITAVIGTIRQTALLNGAKKEPRYVLDP